MSRGRKAGANGMKSQVTNISELSTSRFFQRFVSATTKSELFHKFSKIAESENCARFHMGTHL